MADILEEIKKIQDQLANMCKQTNISIDDFQKAVNNALDDAMNKLTKETNQVITTQDIKDGRNVLYRTTISAWGSIQNEFPTNSKPDEKDVYWVNHQKQVNDALDLRKTLLTKIVDTIDSAASGLLGKL